MPSRYLRESILTSRRVNMLDADAEVFYRRLMSVVDDFGRYEADPLILRAVCYPLKVDSVREADITRWLSIAQSAGLILLYEHNSKQYLELLNLGEPRAKRSRYPAPPQSARTCAQTHSNAPSSSAPSSSTTTTSSPAPSIPSAPSGRSGGLAAEAEAWGSEIERLAFGGVRVPETLNSPDFRQAWEEWLEHRKRAGKPVSVSGARGSLDRCRGWGKEVAIASIRYSIAQDYQGLVEARRNGFSGSGKVEPTITQTKAVVIRE